jgi:hypothetical protein
MTSLVIYHSILILDFLDHTLLNKKYESPSNLMQEILHPLVM